MQIMFLRQHFGNLAIGLSNTDEIRRRKLSRMEERETDWERQRFFEVSGGGVSHPWSDKQDEIRVAITCDGLVCFPDQPYETIRRIFAKVEFRIKGEVYLAYRYPHRTISYGLPDPNGMAEEIVKVAVNHVNEKAKPNESCWVAVDKPQVPKYHRSLLGKVMGRVQNAVNQGADFFKNPKSH